MAIPRATAAAINPPILPAAKPFIVKRVYHGMRNGCRARVSLGNILRRCAGLILAVALGWSAPASSTARATEAAETVETATAPADWPAVRQETFDLVWQTVNDHHFDPAHGGVNWAEVRERYGAQVAEADDMEDLRRLLRAMLNELGQTHFGILSRDAAVFTESQRGGVGTTGAELLVVEDRVFVGRIEADSPAARAGLQVGDEVSRVGALEMEELRAAVATEDLTPSRRVFYRTLAANDALGGPAEQPVVVTLATGATVELPREARRGRWSEPLGQMPAMPLVYEEEREEGRPAYVRFNLFTPALMNDLRDFFESLADEPERGLVIDLRGNPGGVGIMASGLGGWLTDRRVQLGTMRLRNGHFNFVLFPQERAYTGRIAILIDEGSASTSELMAGGFQEAGLARVFGRTSAGAALPSYFRRLPTGDILQYAVADLRTPSGRALEGLGVEPDEVVSVSPEALRACRDPVREAAEAWLR